MSAAKIIKESTSLHDSKITVKAITSKMEMDFIKTKFLKTAKKERPYLRDVLPFSTVIGAYENGEMVGALTVTMDNPLGLPLDTEFDLWTFRRKRLRMCELSGIYTHTPWPENRTVLLRLAKFLFLYCESVLHCDILVTNPGIELQEFFEKSLLLTPLPKLLQMSDSAKSYACYMDMKIYRELFREKGRGEDRDLYNYFFLPADQNFIMPCHEIFHTFTIPPGPQELRQFLLNNHEAVESLDDSEKLRLRMLYNLPEYSSCFNSLNIPSRRKTQRYPVYCNAWFIHENARIAKSVEVTEVSEGGIGVNFRNCDLDGQEDTLLMVAGPGKKLIVKGDVVWLNRNTKLCGFRTTEENPQWLEYCGHLKKIFLSGLEEEKIKN